MGVGPAVTIHTWRKTPYFQGFVKMAKWNAASRQGPDGDCSWSGVMMIRNPR